MKKSLILMVVVMGVIFYFSRNSKNKSSEIVKTDTQVVTKTTLTKSSPELKTKLKEIEVTQNIESFEKEFSRLETKEVLDKISHLEDMAENKNFFNALNEGPVSVKLKSEIALFIRMKQALNKIVLDRQIKEMEENYL